MVWRRSVVALPDHCYSASLPVPQGSASDAACGRMIAAPRGMFPAPAAVAPTTGDRRCHPMQSLPTSPASATSSPPRPCRARCRSAATRRSAAPTASMPSSCPAPRSPRRAPTTAAPGSTASGPAAQHRPFARIDNGRFTSDFGAEPRTAEPAALGPAADARTRRRPTSSTAWSRWPATATRMRRRGCGIHLYAANRSMTDRYFYDADGELLIVPQQGRLRLATELGRDRRRAAGDRRDPARRALPRSSCPTARRAATSARTTARRSGCRTWARSAPTAWPTRATS